MPEFNGLPYAGGALKEEAEASPNRAVSMATFYARQQIRYFVIAGRAGDRECAA